MSQTTPAAPIPITVKRGVKAAALATALCLAASATAEEPLAPLRIGGLLFGDLYYLPSHHSAAGDGAAGAVLRRAYLTFDADSDQLWFGRLRFEVNQSGEFETYRFDAQTKDLYVGRRIGRHRAILGLAATPTFDLIESIWGLRYVARTPMDLQGVASRDTGVFLGGPLGRSDALAYRAMYAPPVDFGSDGNDRARWMGAVAWEPAPGWTLDFYADYEEVDGPRDRSTLQAFAAYQGQGLRWGLQYANQDRQQDPPLELASGFVVADLDERRSLFARVDRLLEPSPKGDDIAYLPYDPSARASTLFAGAEFRLRPRATLTPNVVFTRYDRGDDGERPRSDLHLRLTLFLDFE
jgi:hypothetical protein